MEIVYKMSEPSRTKLFKSAYNLKQNRLNIHTTWRPKSDRLFVYKHTAVTTWLTKCLGYFSILNLIKGLVSICNVINYIRNKRKKILKGHLTAVDKSNTAGDTCLHALPTITQEILIISRALIYIPGPLCHVSSTARRGWSQRIWPRD